jgi:hypothetical protein
LLSQDHSSKAFLTCDRQTDPFSLGESIPATSSLWESERFWTTHRAKFGVDRPGLQPFEHKETNYRSLFYINPKRICMCSKFDVRLTRQIAKGRMAVS